MKMPMLRNVFRYVLFGLAILCVNCAEIGPISEPSGKSNEGTLSEKNTNNPKRIGLWNSYFGDSKWKHMMGKKTKRVFDCEVPCIVSNDKTDPLKYDALYFHARDPQNPPDVRTPNQVYIFLFREAPTNKHAHNVKGKFYNWTTTYSPRSEIQRPYLITERKLENADESMVDLPQITYSRTPNESMIAWVVSHCRTSAKREKYVKLLSKHIKVDIFGGCGSPCPGNCHKTLAESGRYKFYLAFENSACRDYITEKARRPLLLGLVPIVYGGLSREDYIKALPPKSFIDVRNFESPKKLSNYLSYLDRNDTAYLEYFKWRSEYTVSKSTGEHHICQICKALHDTPERNVDLDEFWNPKTECDLELFKKVIGKGKIDK